MNLSKRLTVVAGEITRGNTVADIRTDPKITFLDMAWRIRWKPV